MQRAHARLDLRLIRGSDAPVVVALSGGGDSLALLLMAKSWMDGARRRLVAVTIDHQLQAAGADWARWCEARCVELGVEHHTAAWTGAKPTSGLPAAARSARHRLLADAARGVGADVILVGHTADDLAEGAAMREAGSSVPDPKDWSPSPVWPEGRGVFLLRPLLGARRAALRAWLVEQGERWIEDPANDNAVFARARARATLAGSGGAPRNSPPPSMRPLACPAKAGLGGELILPRSAFDAPEGEAVLGVALVAVSGGERPPRGSRLAHLHKRLRAPGSFVAVLGGARVEASTRDVLIAREAGEFGRRGETPLSLGPGPTVWDGRFELSACKPGLAVGALHGHSRRLPDAQRRALRPLPPAVRKALPAAFDAAGDASCPILAQPSDVTVRSLVMERFLAACGAIPDEASIRRVAKARAAS